MKLKLIHKLLIAMFTCTALVLVLVMLLTRASIDRGFMDFLQQQERSQAKKLKPELADWYVNHGSWQEMGARPREFYRLVFSALLDESGTQFELGPEWEPGLLGGGRRGPGKRGAGPGGSRPGPGIGPGPGSRGGPGPGAMSGGRNALPQRIFLLDSEKIRVIGAMPQDFDEDLLIPVKVGGVIVGWLGVASNRAVKLPEEEAFIQQLQKSLLIGLGLGLAVAALLAGFLARHLSRPVNQVAEGIRELAKGNFDSHLQTSGNDEIARLGDDVNRLSAALSEHETARKRWMSDIAHELRTPLAIISGELEAMSDGIRPLDKTQLASVQEEVKHLASLVDDLHSLTLTDSGALTYKMKAVDISELVQMSVDSFKGRIRDKGLTLHWTNPQQKMILQGDEQRLRQLLRNLLDNAVRYTDGGGKIRIDLRQERQKIHLVLNDSEPGASVEECERLFERLYRLEGSRNRNSGGSGLGLAICRNIVEAHGGKISAQPGADGGLEITATLSLKI